MIFAALYESLLAGELIMIDGGMCRYHLRRNGQLTISAILSNKPGAGKQMLEMLKAKKADGAKYLLAKCPKEYEANKWYARKGFQLAKVEDRINIWKLEL